MSRARDLLFLGDHVHAFAQTLLSYCQAIHLIHGNAWHEISRASLTVAMSTSEART